MTDTVSDLAVKVVKAATTGGLLANADALSAGLLALGWRQNSGGGSWTWTTDPAVGAWTSVTPPTVVVQVSGDDAVMRAAFDLVTSRLRELFEAPAQLSPAGEVDQVSAWWERTDEAVMVDFTPSTSQLVGFALETAPFGSMWVKVERLDADGTAAEQDPDRARWLAQHGSPIERWYLAGQSVLPPDVVALLEADEDSAVATAVRQGTRRRAHLAAHFPPDTQGASTDKHEDRASCTDG